MTVTGQPGGSSRPVRILVATHSPWDAGWGLPQGLIELMRQLQLNGHTYSKYSEEDAFPNPGRLTRIRLPFTVALFQRKLLGFIRQHSQEFDMIVADHQLLPFPRPRYRFTGHMVARSQGLLHFYQRYMRRQADGRSAGVLQRLGWWASGGVLAADRTFRAVDQIYLNNSDELAYVRDELGYGSKCVLVPNAISVEHREALAASCHIERRLSSRTVAFVGVWSIRKGLQEIPSIIRIVRASRPDVRFKLLGTQYPADEILPKMALQDRDAVDVAQSFQSADLPLLLSDVRAGLFPSYVEGFGIGLLEMLAAGIPVAAWDVPGPRDILASTPGLPLVAAGDVGQTATQLLRLIGCDRDEYAAWSHACLERSKRFSWDRVAETIEEVTLRPVAARCR